MLAAASPSLRFVMSRSFIFMTAEGRTFDCFEDDARGRHSS